MEKHTLESNQLQLNNVRLSFPALFKSEQYENQGEYMFKACFLLDPKNAEDKKKIKSIEKRIEIAKSLAWPDRDIKTVKPRTIPLRDGNDARSVKTGEIHDGYQNMMYLACRNPKRPMTVGRDPSVFITEEDGVFYAGCIVNVFVEFFGSAKNNVVGCKFRVVQFVKDGDAFGGDKPINPELVMSNLDATSDDLLG